MLCFVAIEKAKSIFSRVPQSVPWTAPDQVFGRHVLFVPHLRDVAPKTETEDRNRKNRNRTLKSRKFSLRSPCRSWEWDDRNIIGLFGCHEWNTEATELTDNFEESSVQRAATHRLEHIYSILSPNLRVFLSSHLANSGSHLPAPRRNRIYRPGRMGLHALPLPRRYVSAASPTSGCGQPATSPTMPPHLRPMHQLSSMG
jgi:hypothetical protein